MDDMDKKRFVKAVKDALQPEFDKINERMVTKEEFVRVINAHSDKIGEWFEAYGEASKKRYNELQQMIEDLKK